MGVVGGSVLHKFPRHVVPTERPYAQVQLSTCAYLQEGENQMDERMLGLFERARKLKVVDSGSTVVFDDFLKDCDNEIRKQEQGMQRALGRIDQLKLARAMVTQVVSKYCRLQEQADEALKISKTTVNKKLTKKKKAGKKK